MYGYDFLEKDKLDQLLGTLRARFPETDFEYSHDNGVQKKRNFPYRDVSHHHQEQAQIKEETVTCLGTNVRLDQIRLY